MRYPATIASTTICMTGLRLPASARRWESDQMGVDQAFLYRSSRPPPRGRKSTTLILVERWNISVGESARPFGEAVRLISSGQRNQFVVKSCLDSQSVCI
jgi:hypothetical protein